MDAKTVKDVFVENDTIFFKSHNWMLKPIKYGGFMSSVNVFKSHNWMLKHVDVIVKINQ